MNSAYNHWKIVFEANDRLAVEILYFHLEQEGIPCVILNHQDSSYLNILPGKVALHVPESYYDQALAIVNASQNNPE